MDVLDYFLAILHRIFKFNQNSSIDLSFFFLSSLATVEEQWWKMRKTTRGEEDVKYDDHVVSPVFFTLAIFVCVYLLLLFFSLFLLNISIFELISNCRKSFRFSLWTSSFSVNTFFRDALSSVSAPDWLECSIFHYWSLCILWIRIRKWLPLLTLIESMNIIWSYEIE